MLDNPLLKIRYKIPFDEIKASHAEPAAAALLLEAKTRQADLSSSTGPRTYENTLLALEALTEKVDYLMRVVGHLESVATYPELRSAFNAIQPPVSEFYTNIILDSGLWRVLREYAETDEAAALIGAKNRFLKKTLDAFRRQGAELDDTGKAELSRIDVQLAQLTTKFSENVLDSTNEWELYINQESGLVGLPPSAVQAARQSAESKQKTGWRFTLQQPSYVALMTYLDNGEVRRHAYEAHVTRATSGERDNRPILLQILELRQHKAKLLGYANFADLVLEERMAHSGQAALAFIEELKTKTEARFKEENEELRAFRLRTADINSAMEPWDVGYYAEKLRSAIYEFDEEELRPYFPLERVIEGLFEIAGRLYGIQVVEQAGAPMWDPAVKYYSVVDGDGTRIGNFYADWFPRENKRGGAWMDAFLTGEAKGSGFDPHLGLICGNLTPPVGDKPALLTHRDVETIFHEFGHLLHHLLSRVEVRSLAGTNVPWDFVELPSQIMENWCWEKEALDLFARHFETGAPIPDTLFQKMVRARTFRSANTQMRQLGLGVVDLLLHTSFDPQGPIDVVEFARQEAQAFAPAILPRYYAMIAGFTHLFSSPVGYGAGYYSYKWAEVLDADAFTRFRAEGIFNGNTGRAFRDEILSRGDSEDPALLYKRFMGRGPDPTALLSRSGLLQPSNENLISATPAETPQRS